MPHQVIIDADPGIGDALAILLALSDPSLDVLALTASAGVISGGTRGKPMLWGWFPVPAHTPTNQRLRFLLQDAPKTAQSPRGNQRKKRGSGG